MAQQQLLKRTCDYCNSSETFRITAHGVVEERQLEDAARWVTIIRERVGPQGQPQPDVKHYCHSTCAANALRMVEPPAEPGEPANLAALQAAAYDNRGGDNFYTNDSTGTTEDLGV